MKKLYLSDEVVDGMVAVLEKGVEEDVPDKVIVLSVLGFYLAQLLDESVRMETSSGHVVIGQLTEKESDGMEDVTFNDESKRH